MIEGRDIGTVVCPDAEVKVYLVADAAERARRRRAERPEIGAEALATDLRLRDERDAAQMQPRRDAEPIDTTELDGRRASSTASSELASQAQRAARVNAVDLVYWTVGKGLLASSPRGCSSHSRVIRHASASRARAAPSSP